MSVAVLNYSDVVLHRVTTRHAIRMLVRKVAVIVEADDTVQYGPYPRPLVVRLVRDVFAKWLYAPAYCSRTAVLRRDGNRCAYCDGFATTVDHIVPACKGGPWSFLNLVAACRVCNGRKADRTPAQAGMVLRWQPWEPRRIDLVA